ncbi:hypothetical protein ONZ43_g2997 [Nemania bipapillata]|uniref:Uncharacterized protein n=1 Tax=Nemania bipapillata TaxID=110536 RepID=A0ACC2IYF9_9PEZI|nr:hypothetical protein ONZ43_g2997 [Nemania bipapillata]
MAPNYQLYSNFTLRDALEAAGAPKDKAQFQAGEPPITFFAQPPEQWAAVFSTYNQRPFRTVQNPTYERDGHFWWAAEIQRVCDELRRNMPETCRSIETPQTYWDLYKYFDAHDIYHRGAQNLWNVINTLIFENEYVQGLVEKENKMQTEKFTPLFELLAAELLQEPEIQTKLLTWNKEEEQDILEVLTTNELQIFKSYKKYPEHLREAIRVIFTRHHDNIREGLPLAHCLASADGNISNIDKLEMLTALCRYLEDIEDGDPFMDKFDIPNRIINGIVIVDGTSKTAARRARNMARNKEMMARQRDNGSISVAGLPTDDAGLCTKDGGVNHTQRRPSGRSFDSKPADIRGHATNDQKAALPQAHQAAPVPALNDGSQYQPTVLPSSGLPGTWDRGMSQGPFSHQFPSYALSQPHAQASPYMRQQAQTAGPYLGHMPPNGNGYAANTNTRHFQTEPRQHYKAASSFADGPEGLKHQKKGSVSRTNASGKWQHIGSDELHGPRVVYRKESVPGQWRDKESDGAGRRTSNTGANGGYQQFGNTHPQRYNVHTIPRQTDRGGAATQNRPRTSVNLGHSLSEYGCVNAGRRPDHITKFDPCPCEKCGIRDRSIFVSRPGEDIPEKTGVLERFKAHFSKYGEVKDITRLTGNCSAVQILFANTRSSVAAVQTERYVRIDDLGETPFRVNFRTGSQFFTPRENNTETANRRARLTKGVSQGTGLPVSPPLTNELARGQCQPQPPMPEIVKRRMALDITVTSHMYAQKICYQRQTAKEDLEATTAQLQQVNIEDTNVSGDEQQRNIHPANTPAKRKAGEADGDDRAFGQPDPKKLAKDIQPTDSADGSQSPRHGHHQHNRKAGEGAQTKGGRKKNKNRRGQDQPPATVDNSTTAPC